MKNGLGATRGNCQDICSTCMFGCHLKDVHPAPCSFVFATHNGSSTSEALSKFHRLKSENEHTPLRTLAKIHASGGKEVRVLASIQSVNKGSLNNGSAVYSSFARL